MPPIALIGGAIQAGTDIAGAIQSSDARGEAKALAQKAFQEYQNLGMPPDLSAPLVLQQLKQQGMLEPNLEQAINAGVSKVSQIQEKPELASAQMKALQQLQGVSEGGLRPEDRAAFNQLRKKAALEGEAKRQQILQNMAARGVGGSGAELAAQLSASQAGEQGLSEEGDRLAAESSKRALEAIGQAGGLAGQIRGQEFDINRTKAAAEDELQRFNTQNQIAQQARNVAAQNIAKQANLGEAQRVSDYNAQLANQEALRQSLAKRQAFADREALASAKAGMLTGQAGQQRQDAAAIAKSYGNIGSAIGGGLGQIGVYQSAQDAADALKKKKAGVVEPEPEYSSGSQYKRTSLLE